MFNDVCTILKYCNLFTDKRASYFMLSLCSCLLYMLSKMSKNHFNHINSYFILNASSETDLRFFSSIL